MKFSGDMLPCWGEQQSKEVAMSLIYSCQLSGRGQLHLNSNAEEAQFVVKCILETILITLMSLQNPMTHKY